MGGLWSWRTIAQGYIPRLLFLLSTLAERYDEMFSSGRSIIVVGSSNAGEPSALRGSAIDALLFRLWLAIQLVL
jgi:hypothetical protein